MKDLSEVYVHEIDNLENPVLARKFDDFISIYKDAFRDRNEREEPEELREHIESKKSKRDSANNFRSHLLVASKDSSLNLNSVIYGGIFAVYYPQSSSGFYAYIAVDKEYRKKGVARKLVDECNEILQNDAKTLNKNKKLNAVFAEVRKPSYPKNSRNTLSGINRWRFHSSVKVKHLPCGSSPRPNPSSPSGGGGGYA
ncbi:MAG: GNAT family N-acetyltransferase [Deltaproteobacteria bacterium]|nr:GNAT family N-acetyltransferase [Candidatus Zymogenaceae bacterium]